MNNMFFIASENIKIFGYLGAQGRASIIRQLGPILVHIYPVIYNNVYVFRSNYDNNFVFQGHGGPLHQIKGYWGYQNVSKYTSHGDMLQQGKTINNQSF